MPVGIKYSCDREILYNLYTKQNLSTFIIAKKLGVSDTAIHNEVKEQNLKRGSKKCLVCDKEFSYNLSTKYCSQKCFKLAVWTRWLFYGKHTKYNFVDFSKCNKGYYLQHRLEILKNAEKYYNQFLEEWKNTHTRILPNTPIYCKCGCGQEIKIKPRQRYHSIQIPKYITGHNSKGCKFTEEHKQKIGISNKGKSRGKGIKKSPEHRAKLISNLINLSHRKTSIESKIEEILIQLNINYVYQYVLENKYIYDLAIPSKHIFIECDGEYWHSLPGVPEKDKRKNKFAKKFGWKVIHFTEKIIKDNPSYCKTIILKEVGIK